MRLRFHPTIIVVLALMLVLSGLAPAAPVLAQGDEVAVTVVGGRDEPQAYPDQTVDGFAFTDLTYVSHYPQGMEFRAIITPPEGVVVNHVTLFYTFSTGKTGRKRARPGDAPNEWIATPYDDRGLLPWHELDVEWGVRTADGQAVNSEPVHAVYYDPTREWYRAESDDVLVYWYGMPEELGQVVIDAVAGNQQKYLEGFGEPLPYRPLSVIFPPGSDWTEYKGSEDIDDTDFGFTGTIISEAGSTIQRVRTLEPAAIRRDCIWNPENPTLEFQMNQAASTTVHEIAHLYQQEVGVSGPSWWVEGQATFFETFEEYPVHERLRTLAELRGGDFPSFQGDGPGGGALTAQEDGCTHLIYDMGSSFMFWIVDTYGGIETYRAIVEHMAQARTLGQSLEMVTGKTMLELENEWRDFLGVGPVPEAVLNPASILGEPVEPYFEVGEQIVLPPTPFSQPIYSEPKTRSIANTSCFANTAVTITHAGNDGEMNWYEVDCMGMTGWMYQGQLSAP